MNRQTFLSGPFRADEKPLDGVVYFVTSPSDWFRKVMYDIHAQITRDTQFGVRFYKAAIMQGILLQEGLYLRRTNAAAPEIAAPAAEVSILRTIPGRFTTQDVDGCREDLTLRY